MGLARFYDFRGSSFRTPDELTEWQSNHSEAALDPDVLIVDAHHHLRRREDLTYLPRDLIEAFNGHRVIVTVGIEFGSNHREDGPVILRPVGETEFVVREVLGYPAGICAGFVGAADMMLGEGVKPVLEAHIEAGEGRFRGIRPTLRWDPAGVGMFGESGPRSLALDPQFRRGVAQLAPLGLSLDVWAFHHQLDEIADLARAFPETTIIINHVGGVLGAGPYASACEQILMLWRENLAKLARCANVVMKVGGLGMLYFGFNFHEMPSPPDSKVLATRWQPYFDQCIEAFGPRRCMFESNFPVDRQSCAYGTLVNAYKRMARGLSGTERAAYFAGTAASAYRLALPQVAAQSA